MTCGIVSSATDRSITVAAMSAESRARAIGLSLMSTACTAPESRSRAATPSIASMFVPFGGSSSTDTTHSPASRRSWSRVLPAAGAGLGATSRSTTKRATRGSRPSSVAARMAAICAGVVPQQPPISRAPWLCACAANSAK